MAKIQIQTNAKTIARLEYLNKALNKNSHRWGQNPSNRMLSWVDEYDEIKSSNREAWSEFCKKNKLSIRHNAYDCLA